MVYSFDQYIESLLRKYLLEYVKCQMCSGFNTTLTRDQVSRLYFVHCQVCIRFIKDMHPAWL